MNGVRREVDELAALVTEVERTSNSEPSRCREVAERALELARHLGDEAAEMQASYHLGFALHLLSEDHAALDAMERALELAVTLGDRGWEARVLGGLGAVHSGFGDHATAIELLEESLVLRRELGDRFGIAAALNNLGVTYEEMGLMPDRARDLLHEAHAIFVELGSEHGQCASLSHLGALDVALSEELLATDPGAAAEVAVRALETEQRAVEHARRLGDNLRLLGETLIKLARARLATGDADGAQEVIDEARGLTSLVDTTHFRLGLTATQGRVHRLRGDLEAAARSLETGLAAAAADLRPFERIDLLNELVALHEQRGAYAEALQAHRRLFSSTLELRDEVAETRARAVNARLDLERARAATEVERLRAERLEIDNKRLAYEATHDALTGLLNRRGFDAALAVRLADERAYVACLIGDLDHFKELNDTYSHMVGDEVLRRVARIVAGAVRGTDVVARIGGEEIAVLLDEDRGPENVVAICDRIRRGVRDHDWATIAEDMHVTISIGAATRLPGETAEELHGRADAHMYAAKAAGRDRISLDTDIQWAL
ncbi:diguanylate cyclase [Cellulomonas sp. APG4]|uniref:tetratricopeptide repeat-containing diguanylate cyclase n=1 Tax=Cellulomonas sp. APG4 TaxID=1538656 RepID=UPI00137B491C|nr:diguanylate cyclase [Cellulomonas sp. APG4]